MPTAPHPHGDLDCADAEALLAEAEAENTRLRAQVTELNRRLENAVHSKQNAIDEAVALRGRPSLPLHLEPAAGPTAP